jgi:succinate-semialdehyde dehydrogenase/glutarate-semialdehyde dehydrogenase
MQNDNYTPFIFSSMATGLKRSNRDTVAVLTRRRSRPLAACRWLPASDLERALSVTRSAFDVWRHTVPAERARILKNAATLMRERIEHISC